MVNIGKRIRGIRKDRIIIGILAALLLLLCAGMWFFRYIFVPTSIGERNLSGTRVTVYVNLPGAAPSRAIVRTYDKAEYDSFSVSKLGRIRDEIGGKLEGDIPALHLTKGKTVYPVFQESYVGENVIPDNPPRLKVKEYVNVSVLPQYDDRYAGEVYQWQVVLQQSDDGYYFEYDKYPKEENAADNYLGARDEIIVCMAELSYTVDGQDYVSVFAFNVVPSSGPE